MHKCLDCEHIANTSRMLQEHVKKIHGVWTDYQYRHKLLSDKDVICCSICKLYIKTITLHLKYKHKDFDKVKYLKEFPNSKIYSDNYLEFCANKISGIKNPMSKQKVSEQFRKENSPFSIEFYKKRFKNLSNEEIIELYKSKPKEFIKNRIGVTSIEYYLNQGLSKKEAKIKLKERQTTFSLQKCIQKYGIEDGLKRWVDRQEKWHKSYKKSNYSKISQQLFWDIYKLLENKQQIFFAELNNGFKEEDGKNHEYVLRLDHFSMKPDFIDLKNNKIIEFDGWYYHAKTIEKDKRKDLTLQKSGYSILRIKEKEYKKDPNSIVQKCIKFLNA